MIMNRMILNDTWIIQWHMESTKVHGMEEFMEYEMNATWIEMIHV